MASLRSLLSPATGFFAAGAGLCSFFGSPMAGGVLAVSAAGLKIWEVFLDRKEVEKVTKHVLIAIGEVFNDRARITLHVARRRELVHHPLRWYPNNGCVPSRDKKRKALKTGLAWDLAFNERFAKGRLASSGRIPDEALVNEHTMRAWHTKHSNISSADALELSVYMCKVKQIECIKLSKHDGGSLGVITVDLLEPAAEEPLDQVVPLVLLLARIRDSAG